MQQSNQSVTQHSRRAYKFAGNIAATHQLRPIGSLYTYICCPVKLTYLIFNASLTVYLSVFVCAHDKLKRLWMHLVQILGRDSIAAAMHKSNINYCV